MSGQEVQPNQTSSQGFLDDGYACKSKQPQI